HPGQRPLHRRDDAGRRALSDRPRVHDKGVAGVRAQPDPGRALRDRRLPDHGRAGPRLAHHHDVPVAALLVGGVIRVVIALQHREVAGWWILLLGGLLSIVVAAMLYATFPWSGLWVLGTLIAVELLMQGFTWLRFGIDLRRLARSAG